MKFDDEKIEISEVEVGIWLSMEGSSLLRGRYLGSELDMLVNQVCRYISGQRRLRESGSLAGHSLEPGRWIVIEIMGDTRVLRSCSQACCTSGPTNLAIEAFDPAPSLTSGHAGVAWSI